jgi:hypothetical protein
MVMIFGYDVFLWRIKGYMGLAMWKDGKGEKRTHEERRKESIILSLKKMGVEYNEEMEVQR